MHRRDAKSAEKTEEKRRTEVRIEYQKKLFTDNCVLCLEIKS